MKSGRRVTSLLLRLSLRFRPIGRLRDGALPRLAEAIALLADSAAAAPLVAGWTVWRVLARALVSFRLVLVAPAAEHLAFREFGLASFIRPGPDAMTELLARIDVVDFQRDG